MSDLIGPLLPGGNILVQPLGHGTVRPWRTNEWNSGIAIGGPRDGVVLSSKTKVIALTVNSVGWRATYAWNGAAWIAQEMSDPPVGEELPSGRNPAPADPVRDHVDAVIQDLSGRKVSAPDRARLRGAVDKADASLAGREGADSGVGRAIGKPAAFSIGMPELKGRW